MYVRFKKMFPGLCCKDSILYHAAVYVHFKSFAWMKVLHLHANPWHDFWRSVPHVGKICQDTLIGAQWRRQWCLMQWWCPCLSIQGGAVRTFRKCVCYPSRSKSKRWTSRNEVMVVMLRDMCRPRVATFCPPAPSSLHIHSFHRNPLGTFGYHNRIFMDVLPENYGNHA